MSQSNFKQKEISQISLKPNFKVFSQSEERFQRCGFVPSPRDFIRLKSRGLIGLKLQICSFESFFYIFLRFNVIVYRQSLVLFI